MLAGLFRPVILLPQQPPQYPTRLEAGTLNGHGIAGLSAALDYLEDKMFAEFPLGVIRDKSKEGK